jgi:DNA-binding MarR family transcriptional regulator
MVSSPSPPGDASSPPGAESPAEQAWALMHRFVDANSRRGDLAQALGFRLGAGRGKVLFQLRHGPMTLSQLAEVIAADAPYTTLVVDKLEAHGLVERLPHPEDRRRKLVTLTTAGRQAIVSADAILLRPPRAFGSLPARDLEQLTELLARLVGAGEAGEVGEVDEAAAEDPSGGGAHSSQTTGSVASAPSAE